MSSAYKKTAVLLDELELSLRKITGANEDLVALRSEGTDYVLPGRCLTLSSFHVTKLPIWVGANDFKLSMVFRLVYDKDSAQEKFLPVLKNAQRIGWEFDFIPSYAGAHKNVLTVQATCFAKATERFAKSNIGRDFMSPIQLTEFGRFAIEEWAHLFQVIFRQVQRNGIAVASLEPSPL